LRGESLYDLRYAFSFLIVTEAIVCISYINHAVGDAVRMLKRVGEEISASEGETMA
jgi:hypothetical protein